MTGEERGGQTGREADAFRVLLERRDGTIEECEIVHVVWKNLFRLEPADVVRKCDVCDRRAVWIHDRAYCERHEPL